MEAPISDNIKKIKAKLPSNVFMELLIHKSVTYDGKKYSIKRVKKLA